MAVFADRVGMGQIDPFGVTEDRAKVLELNTDSREFRRLINPIGSCGNWLGQLHGHWATLGIALESEETRQSLR